MLMLTGAPCHLNSNTLTQLISHTWSGVFQLEVFIIELIAINALPACSIPPSKVTPLYHEPRDDSVEKGTSKSKALLSSTQGSEVLYSEQNTHLEYCLMN